MEERKGENTARWLWNDWLGFSGTHAEVCERLLCVSAGSALAFPWSRGREVLVQSWTACQWANSADEALSSALSYCPIDLSQTSTKPWILRPSL